MNNKIHLSVGEMTVITLIAGLRRSESKANNRQDNHGFNGQNAWDIEVEGAAAECAYAKFRNQYWLASVNSFKEADHKENVQIRHTRHAKGSLIVRHEDNPEHYYVLVTGTAPHMRVVGWIKGIAAMQEKYLFAPSGRSEAFFVPQKDLRSFPENK